MVGWNFLHDYQRQRIRIFLDPQSDPLGSGYHIIQSQIAIGSGGVFGKGWMNGSQAQLNFLPERSTDFIFAVIGEEFGLLGLIVLLLLYLFIVSRAVFLATQASDTFARLLGSSVALTFFVYVFINAGMVSGLLPVVGVPLPLISYGGTSVVTLLAGLRYSDGPVFAPETRQLVMPRGLPLLLALLACAARSHAGRGRERSRSATATRRALAARDAPALILNRADIAAFVEHMVTRA